MRARVSALSVLILPAFALAVCLCLLAPAPARADSPYVQGLELYRQGKYLEAQNVLRAALPKPAPEPAAPPAPGSPPPPPPAPAPEGGETPHVRAVLGFTLLRMNQLSEAEEQFSLVAAQAGMESVGALGLGWTAFARGKTSPAVDALNEALAKSGPTSTFPDMLRESVPADAQLALGLIALGRGQASEAQQRLEAAAQGPDVLASPKELFLALGDARAQLSDVRGALAAWAEVPRRASRFPGDVPRDELARLKAAQLHESSGNPQEALSGYASLAGGRHYPAEALLGQTRTLLKLGRKAEALPVLRRLVQLDPNLAEPLESAVLADPLLRPALKDWGLSYFHRAEYMAALSRLSAYLDDVDPRDGASHLGMGWSFLRLGHLGRAWDSFSEAATAKPQSADPQVGMAATAVALGRPELARELLGHALAAEPRNALALNTQGHLELSQGDTQKALDSFRAALAARPDYVDSRLSAARILYDRAEYDAAAAEYFRLVTQEKRSTTGWNGLGWARLRLGQYDDALSAFAEARRQNPTLPAAATVTRTMATVRIDILV